VLGEWYDTAAYPSSRIGIGRLVLSLVSDVDPEHIYTLEVVRLATAPIALFPPLKDYHVPLCKTWNRPLQQLAQEAVLPARRGTSSPLELGGGGLLLVRYRRLTRLPPELRLRILEYTDLIPPWKEVTWSRKDRGYQSPALRLHVPAPRPPRLPAEPLERDSPRTGLYTNPHLFLPPSTCRLLPPKAPPVPRGTTRTSVSLLQSSSETSSLPAASPTSASSSWCSPRTCPTAGRRGASPKGVLRAPYTRPGGA
ncbi:hypothetical protein C8A00DRAFT_11172, partial [Chaetomidium leptoderma]